MTQPRRQRRTPAPRPRKRGEIDQHTRRGGGLRRLPDLLGRVLDPAARRRGLAEAKLLTEWPAIVGPRLGARSQPVRLAHRPDQAGGVLTLHVAGSAALELQHSEPQVLERINGFFGYPAVARLHLVQAPPARMMAPPSARPRPGLTSAEEGEVAAAVRAVGDPALQAALARLGRTLKQGRDDAEPRSPATGLAG
jgi:hypothetical protein